MERGFLIPLHPHVTAELGCNLLFHDSRAQFLPSLAGTLVAMSWAGSGHPLPLYTGELWKMLLGFEWMGGSSDPRAVCELQALNGCQWA